MEQATQRKCVKMADGFYSKHLGDKPPTLKRIRDALLAVASDYRPGSWRNLRNAIAEAQREAGYNSVADEVRKIKNPITKDWQKDREGTLKKIKKKKPRCKSITDDDAMKLAEKIYDKNKKLAGIVLASKYTGCRPSELSSIEHIGDDCFRITGAKKREDRGLDRTIKLPEFEAGQLRQIIKLQCLADIDTRKVGNQLGYYTRELWPTRKARPTLYSFRHQLGSDLKSSKLTRKQVAYIMGHRVTASVDVYGDKRKGSGSYSVLPGVSNEKVESLIKENHTTKKTTNKATSIPRPSM